jgi:hypothetical protein
VRFGGCDPAKMPQLPATPVSRRSLGHPRDTEAQLPAWGECRRVCARDSRAVAVLASLIRGGSCNGQRRRLAATARPATLPRQRRQAEDSDNPAREEQSSPGGAAGASSGVLQRTDGEAASVTSPPARGQARQAGFPSLLGVPTQPYEEDGRPIDLTLHASDGACR